MDAGEIRANTVSILRDLIAFDTTSRHSNLAIIDYISKHLEMHGIQSTLIHDTSGQKANLLARLGPEGEGGLMLSGHTDVVPVDGQAWDTPPFELVEKDKKLFGRGTADMKSFIAASLAMIPSMKAYGVKKPVYFVFSYDEEVGCLGAPDIAKYIEAQQLTPELAIIGEPTLMQVVNAHKGIATFNTTVAGLEAHSSKTHLGVNAVMVAAQLIEYLRLLGDHYRAMPHDIRFDPPYTTVHVGTVAGGTARNIIPRECSFQWEIRPLRDEDAADITQKFEAYCATLLPAMQAVHPAAGISTERMSHNPALEPDDDMTSEHLLMQLIGTNRVDAVSFYTEAGIFHHHGIPAIVCGPGSIDQAHRPNEFIEISQIDACIALLQKLMHKLL